MADFNLIHTEFKKIILVLFGNILLNYFLAWFVIVQDKMILIYTSVQQYPMILFKNYSQCS